MRTSDILRMAVHNLWHRRMRTLLNLNGIVTGCIVLLMTASGASGVREAIHALFDSSDLLDRFTSTPVEACRKNLRKAKSLSMPK